MSSLCVGNSPRTMYLFIYLFIYLFVYLFIRGCSVEIHVVEGT